MKRLSSRGSTVEEVESRHEMGVGMTTFKTLLLLMLIGSVAFSRPSNSTRDTNETLASVGGPSTDGQPRVSTTSWSPEDNVTETTHVHDSVVTRMENLTQEVPSTSSWSPTSLTDLLKQSVSSVPTTPSVPGSQSPSSSAPANPSSSTGPVIPPELTTVSQDRTSGDPITANTSRTEAVSPEGSKGSEVPVVDPCVTVEERTKPCSTYTTVKHCLIAIACLAALSCAFMVSTVVLCVKLPQRHYGLRRSKDETEMMCISSILPEVSSSRRKRRDASNGGVLVMHAVGDSDDDTDDNLTLRSFLPDNDRLGSTLAV